MAKKTKANTTAQATPETTAETKALIGQLSQELEQGNPTAETLYAVGRMVTYSVIRKCLDPQGKHGNAVYTTYDKATKVDPYLQGVRRDIARVAHDLQAIDTASRAMYKAEYTADGDRITTIADKSAYDLFWDKLTDTLADGLDLVHTAIVAILTEADKARKARRSLDMETVYTDRVLRRKTYAALADKAAAWSDKETTSIQSVYRAVRQEVAANKSARVQLNGYSYIQRIASDPDSDMTAVVYDRMPRYFDAVTPTADINGRPTATLTTDGESDGKDMATVFCDFVNKAQLTPAEADYLRCRLQGLSLTQIAIKLGTTPDACRGRRNRLAKKAIELGLTPPPKTSTVKPPKTPKK